MFFLKIKLPKEFCLQQPSSLCQCFVRSRELLAWQRSSTLHPSFACKFCTTPQQSGPRIQDPKWGEISPISRAQLDARFFSAIHRGPITPCIKTGRGPTLNEAMQVDDSSKTQAQGTSGKTVQNIRLSLVVIFPHMPQTIV